MYALLSVVGLSFSAAKILLTFCPSSIEFTKSPNTANGSALTFSAVMPLAKNLIVLVLSLKILLAYISLTLFSRLSLLSSKNFLSSLLIYWRSTCSSIYFSIVYVISCSTAGPVSRSCLRVIFKIPRTSLSEVSAVVSFFLSIFLTTEPHLVEYVTGAQPLTRASINICLFLFTSLTDE